MPIKKEVRNRAFWLDWKEKGLSGQELGKKYDLKISGVMGLKKVLNLRGYEEIRKNGERKMSKGVVTGKIRRLISPRGFGFIEAGEGKDLFFHHSSLKDVDFEDLKEGDLVAFEIAKGRKGDEAVKVERLDGKKRP